MSADITGRIDRFVGEDGHQGFGAGSADGFEGRDHAGVDVGEIEFVDAVVVEKPGEDFGYIFLIVRVSFGIAEGTADEHRCSIADVAGDDRFRQDRLIEVGQGGVDGVAKIDAGVDKGAVKIEDDEAWCGKGRHLLTIIDGRAVSSVAGKRGDDARFDWT